MQQNNKPKNNTSKAGNSSSKFRTKKNGTKKGNTYSSKFAPKTAPKAAPARKSPEKKPAIPKLPEGWLLFANRTITASDIRNIFPDDRDVDVWTAAGVVEVVLGEKLTMDIEQMEVPQEPEEDAAWYAEQGIVSQFYITFDREGYQQAMADLKMIVKELRVQICGDTEDLTPVIE